MRTALVIEPNNDCVVGWTMDALRFHWLSILLRERLRIRFARVRGLSETRDAIETANHDLVLVATTWREPLVETTRMFEAIHRRRRRPKIVFFDTSDQSSSPFFPLLPYVDLFVKKQLLWPLSRYREDFHGNNILADYFARTQRFELGDWTFGAKLPPELETRVMLGWNLASARQLVRGLAESHFEASLPLRERSIDVHYRAGIHNDSWYTFHRRQMHEALGPLHARARVVAAVGNDARIPFRQFHAEMRSARLAVSPFGWGEVTDRDFHVVNSRSLLVKPDMSHLRTEPNVYVPGKTYVPVHWDGSDLVDTCIEYLHRLHEAERMTRAARDVYRAWFFGGGFVRKVSELLARVGCSAGEERSEQTFVEEEANRPEETLASC